MSTQRRVCESVLPQVDGADVPLNAGGGAQHFATVLPQALEHHLHGVLQENTQQILLQTSGTAFCYNGTENKRNGNFSYRSSAVITDNTNDKRPEPFLQLD